MKIQVILLVSLVVTNIFSVASEPSWTAGSRYDVETCVETDPQFHTETFEGNTYLIEKEVRCKEIKEPFCWNENGVAKCLRYTQSTGTIGYLISSG